MTRSEPYPGPSTLDSLKKERAAWRKEGAIVVFTNGCFDLLHSGHVDLLRKAKSFGDKLIVGLNEDESIRRSKGGDRPVLPFGERAEILCALASVDRVIGFSEDTPARLIAELLPDVLVKGADWALGEIVGRQEVESAGGRVERVQLVSGKSTSEIIRKIREGARSEG